MPRMVPFYCYYCHGFIRDEEGCVIFTQKQKDGSYRSRCFHSSCYHKWLDDGSPEVPDG